jgi:hypothetical protein
MRLVFGRQGNWRQWMGDPLKKIIDVPNAWWEIPEAAKFRTTGLTHVVN